MLYYFFFAVWKLLTVDNLKFAMGGEIIIQDKTTVSNITIFTLYICLEFDRKYMQLTHSDRHLLFFRRAFSFFLASTRQGRIWGGAKVSYYPRPLNRKSPVQI